MFLTVFLFLRDRCCLDVVNSLKFLLDSLAHAGTMHDDSQIKKLIVEMREPDGNARVEVHLEEIE